MQRTLEAAANTVAACGAAACSGGWLITTMGWLNENSAAVVALVAILTAIPTTIIGLIGVYMRVRRLWRTGQ